MNHITYVVELRRCGRRSSISNSFEPSSGHHLGVRHCIFCVFFSSVGLCVVVRVGGIPGRQLLPHVVVCLFRCALEYVLFLEFVCAMFVLCGYAPKVAFELSIPIEFWTLTFCV